jgi:DHA1 family tetracycline resistance protein-like MFS transporter
MLKKRDAAIGFIFVTLLIDVMGIGIIIPMMPTLIRGFTGGDLSVASQYSGWLMASYASMQFIFSPVLGG